MYYCYYDTYFVYNKCDVYRLHLKAYVDSNQLPGDILSMPLHF